MNIAICIDNNFIMQAGVLLTSIINTNKNNPVTVFVFSESLNETSKEKLSAITDSTNVSLVFKKINLASLPPLPLEGKEHITVATYYRLLIPYLLPEDVDKILYLDCDMIVLDSLTDFYNTDLTNTNAAAVIDMFNDDKRINTRLHYSETAGYFNAGMLLMNLTNWRKNQISEKAIKFLGEHPELCEAHDQDALNHALNGDYLKVSARYNMQLDFFCDFKYLIVKDSYYSDIEESRLKPCIIHFTGPTKPWLKNCKHPYTCFWDFFQNQTKWKNMPKRNEYHGKKLFKYQIKECLIKLKLYKEKKEFLPETFYQAKQLLKQISAE